MLIEARDLAGTETLETDVCIIGAGPAGTTLAFELAAIGVDSCVLESGGLEYEPQTQALARGKSIGLPYSQLDAARLRFLGGTSNHWSGWCRKFDAIDFEARRWVRDSGWPIERAAMEPYYGRAFPYVQTGPLKRVETAAEGPAGLEFSGDAIGNTFFWLSPPTRFGTAYRPQLQQSARVRVILHANAVELVANESVNAIERVRVKTLQDQQFEVRARRFVVATGGIENARLLLNSNRQQTAGIGNQHDLVGRYFMDHAGIVSGTAMIFASKETLGYYDRHVRLAARASQPERRAIGAVWLSEATQREHGLLNYCALLEESSRGEAFGFEQQDDGASFGDALGNVLSSMDDLFADTYRRTIGSNPAALYRVVNMCEPSPNRDSRVTLGTERDALGLAQPVLDWRMNASDRETVIRAHELLGQALGGAELGRLLMIEEGERPSWPPLFRGRLEHGWHHMGTTRMHSDPRQGVVDPDCRVHGMGNLYIAGSAVFPTYSFSQPTLTIVALAIRLAGHLGRSPT